MHRVLAPAVPNVTFMVALLEKPLAGMARKNLTVCVLDDEPDQVGLVTTRLEKAGYTTVGTTDP
jgi:hypothetical protein